MSHTDRGTAFFSIRSTDVELFGSWLRYWPGQLLQGCEPRMFKGKSGCFDFSKKIGFKEPKPYPKQKTPLQQKDSVLHDM
jgi:hypothetical protein